MPPAQADLSWFDIIVEAATRIERLTGTERMLRPSPPAADGAGQAAGPETVEHRSPGLEPALDLLRQERFQDALESLAGEPRGQDPDALLLKAMLLVSSGDSVSAERVCRDLIRIDELNAGAHYIIALCREHTGDREGAIEHDQLAAYLDNDFAMPHLHLGLLARRLGDFATAERELQIALGLFRREDAARIVLFGGGFGREALIDLCGAELVVCGGQR
jgi:chemotaxis protein methyltransferase CheR